MPIVFTAHSVPEKILRDGDPYEYQTKHTAELVARDAKLPGGLWHFAFRNQGMSGGAWLGLAVEDTILRLRDKGYRGSLFSQW